uniref:Capsid protein n=1 Tax=Okra mosaic virus TaxID=70822 RepID=O89512_9VIRU|nr:virion protein [Okra mosaic virus]
MTSDRIVAPQLAVNTKSSTIPLEPGITPPTISYPFQIQIASLGTKPYSDAISIASNATVAGYTSLYRHAILHSLKATIHPTGRAPALSPSYPLPWVPANSSATPAQILSIYGGQMFCTRGAINSTQPIDFPCNLTQVNPTIKDSVTFTDTPKLIVNSTVGASPPTSPTCFLTITGIVTLHSPLLQASA